MKASINCAFTTVADYDFYALNQVQAGGEPPRARYRGTCVVSGDSMILHGGHDGNRHLQDTHVFDFVNLMWSTLITEGPVPTPRDSHIAVIYGKSMYLYGGSTGSAMGDFHELKLEFRRVWSPVYTYRGYFNGMGTITPAYGAAPGAADCSSSWLSRSLNGNVTSAVMGYGASAAAAGYSGAGSLVDSALSAAATAAPGILAQRRKLPRPPSTPHVTMPPTPFSSPPAAGSSSIPSGDVSALRYEVDISPGARFCHIGVVHDNCLYVFGGYDGSHRSDC